MDSLDAYAGKGDLAGPNSEYCKRQKEYIAQHPCKAVVVGKPIPIPGGGQIDNIAIKCEDLSEKSPYDKAHILLGSGGDLGRVDLRVSTPVVLRPPPLFPVKVDFPVIFKRPSPTAPFGGYGGPYFVDGRSGNSPIKVGDVPSKLWPFLNDGGRGGVNLVRQSPETGPQKRKVPIANAPAKPPSNRTAVRPAPSNGGGGGTNSAMDRLGGVGGSNAINSVSGNAGYTAPGGGYRAPCPTCATKNTQSKTSSGGGGGTNKVQSQTTQPQPRPSRSGPDTNFSYGGCSDCGKDKFIQPR